MNLVLIGLRGSGKSTVGRILAERLQWGFCDTDELVQSKAGMTIRELFEKSGEGGFRQLESDAVRACAAADHAVIATGGGAILDPTNVVALRLRGFVVHLTADPSELWRRIVQDKSSMESRPKLSVNSESGIDELKRLMRARAGAYAQARDAEVSVENRSPDEIADAVMLLMRAHGVLKTKTEL